MSVFSQPLQLSVFTTLFCLVSLGCAYDIEPRPNTVICQQFIVLTTDAGCDDVLILCLMQSYPCQFHPFHSDLVLEHERVAETRESSRRRHHVFVSLG